MVDFDVLRPGAWLGPMPSQADLQLLETATDDVELLKGINARLKAGDFSVRSKLQEFIMSCRHPLARRQAIQLFCYTCRHEDVSFLGNLLVELDGDDVFVAIGSLPETLSPEVVPYLFALLEDYDDLSDAISIVDALDTLFPLDYDEDNIDFAALAEHFKGFAAKLLPGKYYYGGGLAHPGALCQSLIMTTAQSRHLEHSFPLADLPVTLSIWSGKKCPVFFGDSVNDQTLADVMGYVQEIAAMGWEEGAKYFYGHKIV